MEHFDLASALIGFVGAVPVTIAVEYLRIRLAVRREHQRWITAVSKRNAGDDAYERFKNGGG